MATKADKEAAIAEAVADRKTTLNSYRWTWRALWVATAFTFFGNLAHHYDHTIRSGHGHADLWFWTGMLWAAIAPTLLMLAVHAVPTIEQMLKTEKDRILVSSAWAVTFLSMIWSGYGLFHAAVAFGTDPRLAIVAPLAIDGSVFLLTRGVVRAAPILVRMEIADVTSTATVDAINAPMPRATKPPTTPTSTPLPRETAPTPRETVRETAPITRETPRATEAPTTHTHAFSEVEDAYGDTLVRDEHRATARELIANGATKATHEQAARALALAETHVSNAHVARETGIKVDAVRRLLNAARDQRPPLSIAR